MLCQRKEALCVPRITPELSRPAERARRWFNHSASAETAKRARLERFVRPLKAMLFCPGNPGTESALACVNPQPTAEA